MDSMRLVYYTGLDISLTLRSQIPEQVVLLLVQDNLDVACASIEKAAMERAVLDVDEGFAASYDVRRRHCEVHRVY